MLVLSRHIGERIIIDNQIVVEVLQVKGNRIRLGIQAPPGSSVLRQELIPRTTEEVKHGSPVGEPASTA